MDILSLAVGGAATAGLAAVVRRGREHRADPAGLADELNWAFLVDEGTVLLKDGAFLAAFRYRGPDLGSATQSELDALGEQLNDALLPYGDGWMFHVDAVRTPAPPYPESRFSSVVAAWIDAERRTAFQSSRPQFVSEYVLSVTYLPPKELYSRIARLFVQRAPGSVSWSSILGGFTDAITLLEQRLASRLKIQRLDSNELVTHLHRCLTGLPHSVTAPRHGAYLNTVLASQELTGGFAPRVGDLHLGLVSIVAYPSEAGVGSLDVLNTLPFRCRWSNRFIPVGQQAADRLIKRAQRQWFMGRKGMTSFLREVAAKDQRPSEWREREEAALFHDADATDMAHDAAHALAESRSGAVRYGFATQVVIVMDEDAERVRSHGRAVRTALEDRGFAARIENVNAVDALFGTLPGHGYPNLRRPLLHTANIAALWPVTSVWPGVAENPSQYFPAGSPPLMHVATDGSTPFRLNLHVGDVGHTLVVGATGGGKSTFVGLTVAQWQRYDHAQTFVFDVGYSHWLLAKAAGAQHYDIGTGRLDAVAFQPLADIDQEGERAWAASWLEMLLDLQGVTMTPGRRARLDHALVLVAGEPRPYRTLTELTVQLQDSDLAAALKPYTVGGTYGRLLDAEADVVGTASYQVFELRHLMDMDEKVLVPVLLYLFRRVEQQLDGSPTLIVIEELWAPLMRTAFSNRIKQWLLTLRKQNAAVMLVAHSLAQFDAVPAKQVLIESCPTKVLLPNAEAASSANLPLYRDLGLNDRETALVARAVPKRDYYVTSPLGSRMVTLDLGALARAFLGTPDGVTIEGLRTAVEDLAARQGDQWPAAWLEQLGLEAPPSTASGPPGSVVSVLAPHAPRHAGVAAASLVRREVASHATDYR
jgi:type IV secretion/conjugal transfer VirB4 family ATPase